MTRLIMRRGPDTGTVYEIKSSIVTIGGGSKNDIVIVDNEVSRNHCRLVRVENHYQLEDLGSHSGTFVNGRRVSEPRALVTGCLIELGDTITLAYEYDPKAEQQETGEVVIVSPFLPTEDDHYYLILRVGPEAERTYPLKDDQIIIGRDLSNDIVVQDPEVSRAHIRLTREKNGYRVEDLNSTNGTHINGKRLEGTYSLHVDDMIELAPNSHLRYVREVNAEPIPIEPNKTTALLTNRDTQNTLRPEFMSMQGKRHTTRLGTGITQGSLVNHIFLAYAREDWEPVVAPLMLSMQDGGIQVWVEQYLVSGGEDWRAAVEQALAECRLLVLIVSPEALESRHVKLQYRYFINREKPVIPFIYKPVDKMPSEFANILTIPYDQNDSKRSFQRLILEILHKRV